MCRVIVTTWKEGEDEEGIFYTDTEEVVGSGLTRASAERLAGQWAEARAGDDVTIKVEDE